MPLMYCAQNRQGEADSINLNDKIRPDQGCDNLAFAFSPPKRPCANQTSKQDLSVFDPSESWKEDLLFEPLNSTFFSNEHVNSITKMNRLNMNRSLIANSIILFFMADVVKAEPLLKPDRCMAWKIGFYTESCFIFVLFLIGFIYFCFCRSGKERKRKRKRKRSDTTLQLDPLPAAPATWPTIPEATRQDDVQTLRLQLQNRPTERNEVIANFLFGAFGQFKSSLKKEPKPRYYECPEPEKCFKDLKSLFNDFEMGFDHITVNLENVKDGFLIFAKQCPAEEGDRDAIFNFMFRFIDFFKIDTPSL